MKIEIYLSDIGEKGTKQEEEGKCGPDLADLDDEMEAARQYELSKLAWYYAICTFSCVEAARQVLNACDGVDFVGTGTYWTIVNLM